MTQEECELIFKTNGIKVLYRALLRSGKSNAEAGNIVAGIMGLGQIEKGWTVRELQYLQFFKQLNNTTTSP